MDSISELNIELHHFLIGLDDDWRRRQAAAPDPSLAAAADAFVADWEPQVRARLDATYARLSTTVEAADDATRARAAEAHRLLIQPYFLTSRFCRRCVDKPLGYAGDYGAVEMIYSGTETDPAPIGRLLGGYTLQTGPCEAHRGRLPWTHARLAELGVERPRLLSFACGPEVVLRRWVEAGNTADIVLADHDANALAFAQKELQRVIRRTKNTSTVRTVTMSAREVMVDPGAIPLLGGPFDAVMVLGLLDYLPDAVVVRFLKALSATLRPGGTLLTSNLTGPNPWRALMELTSDWVVAHRTVAGFEALVSATTTLAPTRTDIHASGVNLYNASIRL
ncbi:MAG: class I SAM-dependent methyltransferase [Pseudomonadota bacterium]|nr:class I SAM-dependent methyltransferase [Pseudomonadota bacterium]